MNRIRREVRDSMLPCPEPGDDRVCFCFAPEFTGFGGHYPGRPILPAFVQVMAALAACESLLGLDLALAEVGVAKFTRTVQPGEVVSADCRLEREGGVVKAEVAMAVEGEAASLIKLRAEETRT